MAKAPFKAALIDPKENLSPATPEEKAIDTRDKKWNAFVISIQAAKTIAESKEIILKYLDVTDLNQAVKRSRALPLKLMDVLYLVSKEAGKNSATLSANEAHQIQTRETKAPVWVEAFKELYLDIDAKALQLFQAPRLIEPNGAVAQSSSPFSQRLNSAM